MSYIIAGNKLIAKVTGNEQPSGADVKFGTLTCSEAINADRDVNLINARTGKISNAAKWDAVWARTEDGRFASEVNPGEFLIR